MKPIHWLIMYSMKTDLDEIKIIVNRTYVLAACKWWLKNNLLPSSVLVCQCDLPLCHMSWWCLIDNLKDVWVY